MEIKYPIVLVIVLILFIVLLFVKINRKNQNKKKVANTHFVKNTDTYKKIIKKYKIVTYALFGILFVGVIASSLITSRLISVSKKSDEIYDRDIILCLDVSGSMTSLDKEIVDIYKDIIKDMNGERFGIVLFDSSAYTILPLTNDYDYIQEIVDQLSVAFGSVSDLDSYDYDAFRYIYDGTSEGEGSSVIGDGLASCVLSFPKLDKDRSRALILATDNLVAGAEIIKVPEAGELAKKYNISVYPLDTYNSSRSKETQELMEIAKKTGGKYFGINDKSATKEIIKEIETKEKSLRETNPITVEKDMPMLPLILVISSLLVLLIMERVVKL